MRRKKANLGELFGAVWCALDMNVYKTSADIGDQLGVSGATVRATIRMMRESGLPIVSDLKYGYKKALTDEEIWLCIRQIEDRIAGLQNTVQTMKRMVRG